MSTWSGRSRSVEEPLGPEAGETALALARQTVERDAAAVAAVLPQLGPSFLDAVRLLLACQGKVLVTGMGTSGATARRIAHLLSVGGTPAVFVHAADGLHGGLGAVTADDCVIAISKGGESDELNEYVRRVRERHARVLTMTATADSTLARLGDVRLVIDTPAEVDPGNMIAMGSALAMCSVGDALTVALMEVRRYPWEAFMHTHPGGAVGHRIQRGEPAPGKSVDATDRR
jgi:arabinose-5-phosphate isomerase